MGGFIEKKATSVEELIVEEARYLVASLGNKFEWPTIMRDTEEEEVVGMYLHLHPKTGPNKDAAPSEMATPIPQPMASGVYNPLLALELIGYGYYIGF